MGGRPVEYGSLLPGPECPLPVIWPARSLFTLKEWLEATVYGNFVNFFAMIMNEL